MAVIMELLLAPGELEFINARVPDSEISPNLCKYNNSNNNNE